ncbi:DNA-nicking endonuclease, Smr domain [Methylobacterium sp. 174MFSha1.1]|uniref:Smr/MutS family protein n=1 Tax=Methylobacterium sp. 174MFSha1.1 TaxID=1502749 RepID=UPI0008E25F6B|nr:Smr/MutS family protein [Methylobacterium sp. 174MFSha1.1]SFU98909.1 DNA-nicking endonuclease, Smr domain [Methylobacterium sp. 174MFSha1.1]
MTEPPRFRRRRRLSAEETRLWAEISRLVTPLRGRAVPSSPPPPPEPVSAPAPLAVTVRPGRPAAKTPAPKPSSVSKPTPVSKPSPVPTPPPPAPALPPLAPLERRVRTALRRGSRSVDASIDLHGMRQSEAHAALIGFLHRSRAQGHAVVLVVTGKGGAGGDPYGERGVLRRSVPHWLRLPELRPLVVGFEEAAHHHGGGGALYIRLRRR